MKTILVPIDFSDGSLAALTTADKLGEALGFSVTLMHVVRQPTTILPPDPGLDPAAALTSGGLYDDEAAVDRARMEMTRFLVRAPDTLRPKQVIFRAGVPADAIVSAANALHAEMIVMSTHGRRGLSRVFLGSTAEEVVRKSDVPVLTVKPFNSMNPDALLT